MTGLYKREEFPEFSDEEFLEFSNLPAWEQGLVKGVVISTVGTSGNRLMTMSDKYGKITGFSYPIVLLPGQESLHCNDSEKLESSYYFNVKFNAGAYLKKKEKLISDIRELMAKFDLQKEGIIRKHKEKQEKKYVTDADKTRLRVIQTFAKWLSGDLELKELSIIVEYYRATNAICSDNLGRVFVRICEASAANPPSRELMVALNKANDRLSIGDMVAYFNRNPRLLELINDDVIQQAIDFAATKSVMTG